jgi:hypothetical protein
VGVLEQANAALRERVGVLEHQPPQPAPHVRMVFDVWCLTDECAAITQEMDVTDVVALRNDLQRVQEQLQVQQYSVCKLMYSIICLMRRMYKGSFLMKGGKERLQRYVRSHMLCTCVCTFAVLVGSTATAYRGAGSSKQCSCGLFFRDRSCDEPLRCLQHCGPGWLRVCVPRDHAGPFGGNQAPFSKYTGTKAFLTRAPGTKHYDKCAVTMYATNRFFACVAMSIFCRCTPSVPSHFAWCTR